MCARTHVCTYVRACMLACVREGGWVLACVLACVFACVLTCVLTCVCVSACVGVCVGACAGAWVYCTVARVRDLIYTSRASMSF